MSARGWLVPNACLALALGMPASGAAPQSRPASQVQASGRTAATRPVSIGSIPEAMRHLATVPRPKNAREAAAAAERQPPGKDLPYSKVLPGAQPGSPPVVDRSQRLASARHNGRMPSTEEMRRAFPDADLPAAGAPSEPGVLVAPPSAPYGYGYGPRGSRLPDSRRDFANYRYFGGRPSLYGHGYHSYPYGGDDDAGDIYRFGFLEGADYWRFYDESNARTDSVLKHYSGHLAKALEHFNRGRYGEAADAFRLAAEMHQGDPAARLYAAHAMFAIGRYRDAIPFLRRAYELQPRFIYLGFDIRDDYGQRADFENHLAALEAAQRQSPANLDRMVLLGYVLYFSNQRDRAFSLFREADRLRRGDPFITALLDNSKPPDVMLETSSTGQ